jgi:UDP-GlcNAc:undecaprenyl-phosphate GlcNAc-1-phosphate transferase
LLEILFVIVFVLSIYVSNVITPAFCKMFLEKNKVAKNYKGDYVPQGVGVFFPICCLMGHSVFMMFSYLNYLHKAILVLTFGIFVASLVGFIDDIFGSKDVQGLSGHFKALLKGRITTGSLKAIVGLLVSFIISNCISSNIASIILDTFLIALYINLLNLLDLRPGRCIKFYLIFAVVFITILSVKGDSHNIIPFIPLLGTVLGYLPNDLKARCMMGDAGSNVLGITVGIFAAISLNIHEKIVNLILLILIHLFAEKYSISDFISKNKVLSWLDELGRGVEID